MYVRRFSTTFEKRIHLISLSKTKFFQLFRSYVWLNRAAEQ
jgi:hypothetical protein